MRRLFVLLVLIAVVALLAGCVAYVSEPILRDPTWLRVAAFNNSPYELKMEGVFQGYIAPYGAVYANVECRGRHDGVAHAYKEIGRSASGKFVEKAYMGERTFSLYVDGRNQMYQGEPLDAWVVFYDGSFRIYRNVIGEKSHIPYARPCSIFLPDIKFEWGK